MEIESYFDYFKEIPQIEFAQLEKIAQKMVTAILNDKSIFLIGNGGSASTVEHFETDLSFIKESRDLPKVKVFALTANSSLISALANDIGFENVFLHQLKRKANKNDICFLVSASGNSDNLIQAAKWSNQQGIKTIALLGFDGGQLSNLVEDCFIVETEIGKYGNVEDLHLAICHSLSARIKELL
jgi:D-sedoheptulose 7-phosphate isomerase